MADQLSLRLEADQLPDLPDLRPMLPRPLPEPFDSDEHLFEPWWGGERALVSIGPADAIGNGEVRIDGSHFVQCTQSFVNNGSGAMFSLNNNYVACDDLPGPTYITPAIVPTK